MPPKVRQLKASLRKAGANQVSQEGSHTKWKHPLIPSTVVVLSGHDGDDAIARGIQRDEDGEAKKKT